MSPQRRSGRRFAAFVAALGIAAAAIGAVALPRLAADGVPTSLKAKTTPAKTLVEQKLADRRCRRDRDDYAIESALQARA